MPLPTAESLVGALRASGLYTPAEADALEVELAALGDDPAALMRHLVAAGRVSVYQLKKVVHGRAAELLIGPYVVVDKLGEGGMGRVYRARHTRLGREVALKVVRSSLLANPVVRGRYEREVQAAFALSHPNVVSVFNAGSADGRYYLEMELVDGVDLARLVRDHGVLSVAEACEYVRQAALGLHHAHDLGFVHRDIKPSNVVVSGERHVPEAGGPAHVKILDMGLVRWTGADDLGGAGPDLTRDGTVVGTPDYMPPEQARNSSTVDRRGDLYSLGATFYFLLTGKPPFPDGSALEKILNHVSAPAPPLQAARPDVPTELARVVAKLLAKKPADRFATAADLAAALAPLARIVPGAAPFPLHTAAATAAPVPDPVPPLTPPSLAEGPVPPAGNGEGSPWRAVGPSDDTPRPEARRRKPPPVRSGWRKPVKYGPPAVARANRAVVVGAVVTAAVLALVVLGLALAVAFRR